MKLKSILSMCAKSKTVLTIDGEDCQWIGAGGAMYKICGLPKMDADALLALMDVQEEKKAEYYCAENTALAGYNLGDFDSEEALVERAAVRAELADVQIMLDQMRIIFGGTAALEQGTLDKMERWLRYHE